MRPYGKKKLPRWLRCSCCMGGTRMARDVRRNPTRARREGKREAAKGMEEAW